MKQSGEGDDGVCEGENESLLAGGEALGGDGAGWEWRGASRCRGALPWPWFPPTAEQASDAELRRGGLLELIALFNPC